MIALQFLEPGPHLRGLSPQQVGDKLQTALEILPIDALLLGWDIPFTLEEICRKKVDQFGTKLYRWHPLLTGDGKIVPKEEWRTRNLFGQPISGFRDLPEFTFICPNNPEAREMIFAHIADLAGADRYDGIFLDRMRFPSPAADPVNLLACFCTHCREVAADLDLDLEEVRHDFSNLENSWVLQALFCKHNSTANSLNTYLDFRQKIITRFIQETVSIIQVHDVETGLDCFSPSLARIVGQELCELAPLADWTKIMVYGHAFGPATLPFEFTDMAKWFAANESCSEDQSLEELANISGISLSPSLAALRNFGFSPQFLAGEVVLGKRLAGGNRVLAGIELVEIPAVSELNADQIEADLRAIKTAGADGISLSWDLWHIPLERLELIRSVWYS